jgi:hypothetical protein
MGVINMYTQHFGRKPWRGHALKEIWWDGVNSINLPQDGYHLWVFVTMSLKIWVLKKERNLTSTWLCTSRFPKRETVLIEKPFDGHRLMVTVCCFRLVVKKIKLFLLHNYQTENQVNDKVAVIVTNSKYISLIVHDTSWRDADELHYYVWFMWVSDDFLLYL